MKRRVYLYLPESYQKNPDKRYPVLYMFDGHNVFFDADATFGKSWGMKDYLDTNPRDLIVVGIACNEEGNRRLNEYTPVDFVYEPVGSIKALGKIYMDWLISELKPYIDSTYRTLPDREHTAIAGSSMGGLMSLYAVCHYNRVFQRAACLSPSLWVAPTKVQALLESADIRPDSLVYMDYGTEEMYNHPGNPRILSKAAEILLEKDVPLTLRIVSGGSHCEASWEKQIPVFMQCLGL